MKLFRSFPARFLGHTNTPQNWQIMFYKTNSNTNVNPYDTYSAITMYQEYSSIPLWNPVQSIVFCSDYLHITPTQTGIPELNQSLISSGNNANLLNVLTDFQVQLSNTNLYYPIVYFASVNPEQRMIDLRTTQPMNTVDIKAYWRTPFNDLVPLHLHAIFFVPMMEGQPESLERSRIRFICIPTALQV